MTALTPTLALDYLKSLSADYIDGVVLDANGAVLAGAEHLHAPARAFTTGATEHGATFAARDETHTIFIVTGPHALPRVARHDVATALVALGGDPSAQEMPSQTASDASTDALLAASRDTFRRHSAI